MPKLKYILKGLSIPILLLITWEILALYGNLPSSLNARPSDIFATSIKLLYHSDYSSENILYNIFQSLFRLIIGVFFGALVGLFSSYANTKFKNLRSLTNPFLTVIGPIPIVIWMPIFMLIFSDQNLFKIALISFATFLLIYLKMFSAFSTIDKKYIELSRIYEKSYWIRFTKISLPHSIEEFLTTLRFCIAIGWIVLFIVEYSVAEMHKGGLGYTIERFRQSGKTEELFGSVLILALISYVLDKLIVVYMKKKTKWKSKIQIE